MKTNTHFSAICGFCPTRPAKTLSQLACMAASALWLAVPQVWAQDSEVILHPGTITGEIKIMDPDNPGLSLPIYELYVSASASAPGGISYSANVTVYNNNRYTLVVEGGPWRYSLYVRARVVKFNYGYCTWNFQSIIVAQGETVTQDFQTEAFVDIQMNVTGETVKYLLPSISCALNPTNSFYFSPSSSFAGNRCILPVVASTTYRPHTVGITGYMVDTNDRLTPKSNTNVVVNAGQTVPVIFNIVPGYIEGTITLVGATISSGSVSASTRETATNSTGSAYTSFSSPGTFRFPCIPAKDKNLTVSCSLQTTAGTYLYGTNQYPDVLAGEAAVCNWIFNVAGRIAGKVDIVGFPTKSPNSAQVTASGPSSSANRSAAADGTYQFTDLPEGLWTIYGYEYIYTNVVVEGASCYRYQQYRLPQRQVQLPAGGNVTGVDFAFNPGFLTGRLLHPNCAALPFLYYSQCQFSKYNPAPPTFDGYEQIYYNYASSPSGTPRPNFANQYWAVASPGPWQMTYAQLSFLSNAVGGLSFSSSLTVQDYYYKQVYPYGYVYNIPPQTVPENANAEYNVDYKTGLIRVRLTVADGRLLSSPYVSGSYLSNAFGLRDKYVSISGSANSQNVVEGLAQLYALPGTYQLSAQGKVEGATTTFGPPFRVTVDPGDVVEKDPEAPDVNITFPPGEYLTCDESLDVTGTVTDASGVASFKINGQDVPLDAQGNFTFPAVNLVVGNNILHFEAVDIYDKVTTVDRTVIRNGIPLAHNDAYSLYDDEVINLAAPGVLANDTDADNDAMSVTARTDPASGTLTMTSDGAFTYTPVQGVGGLFSFTYTIADGKCGDSTATVSIEVTVRNQPPVIQATTASVNEDTTLTLTVVTDPDNDPLTVTITAGPANGSASFSGGVLTYVPSLNYNGLDTLAFTASDGRGGVVSGTLAITVLPVNDAPIADPKSVSLDEDTPVVILPNGSDVEGGALTFAVVSPPEHGTVAVNGDGTFTYTPAANYYGPDGFTYSAGDGHLLSVPALVSLTIIPVNDPPVLAPLVLSAVAITENGWVLLSGSLADPDIGDTHTVEIAWSDGSTSTLSLGAGELSFSKSHQFLDDNPTGTPSDVSAIMVTVTDAAASSDADSVELTVNNVAPVIVSLTAPIAPVPVSLAPAVTVQFTDVGTLDTHSVTFAWGDGASTGQPATAGSASATHSYAVPGVYTVTVTVTDDDTGAVNQSTPYVVVYDPTGSFVTGGGWIESPTGAYTPDPALSGRAHFGFVSRYEKGATVPTGKTDFRFVTANLDFHSTSYEWLVVAGMKAKFKGVGTINGMGQYGFILTASDGNAPGRTDVDRFRIQIWDRTTGLTIYDNQLGDDQMADASDAIDGGAIEIHQVK